MKDPTKNEMIEFLKSQFSPNDQYDWAAEEAIYWFANHWHGGQWSNLYSVLSTSPFKPSPLANGIEDELTLLMYESLEREFVHENQT